MSLKQAKRVVRQCDCCREMRRTRIVRRNERAIIWLCDDCWRDRDKLISGLEENE